MALTLFEDFEDGTVGVDYPGKSGSAAGTFWTVDANNRSTGFGPPKYRPSPDTTNGVPAPSGVAGSQALRFPGSSAFALNVEHTISDGLGGYFYSDAAAPGGGAVSSSEIQIAWNDLYANRGGSLSVDRIGADLDITLTWFEDAELETETDSVTVTDFLPIEGLDATGLWMEVRFTRTDGWLVRDATSGATIASGSYPWAIPAVGLEWELSLFPNPAGPLFLSGSTQVVVDHIYGYPGRDRGTVVRQYPRDDEHGYSGGRRRFPPPRLQRIVGRQS